MSLSPPTKLYVFNPKNNGCEENESRSTHFLIYLYCFIFFLAFGKTALSYTYYWKLRSRIKCFSRFPFAVVQRKTLGIIFFFFFSATAKSYFICILLFIDEFEYVMLLQPIRNWVSIVRMNNVFTVVKKKKTRTYLLRALRENEIRRDGETTKRREHNGWN